MKNDTRPKYNPIPGGSMIEALSNEGPDWIPIIHCYADFPPELFETALLQLVHHPEYNSTLILRSEVLSETETDFPNEVPAFKHYKALRNLHRKLLARRPERDPSLEQHCTFYNNEESQLTSLLILTPITPPNSPLPYYHPAVSHLAFRYIANAEKSVVQIDVVPLLDIPLDINSRLYRTCLSLLETIHRYGWGAMTNYKKRMHHDTVIPRDAYQDLYLIMRERHKHIVGRWQEETDPLKHVFEDIGIATFLMLLWKDMYSKSSLSANHTKDQSRPWLSWPRPPGGFLDLGCGNGLLTHILSSEGYAGTGIDLRARNSWSSYSQSTQDNLKVHALDPTSFDAAGPGENGDVHSSELFPSGVFVIGNHADELTPWVPVLSTLHDASGYLSIPCCPWTFDAKFERSRHTPYPLSSSVPNPSGHDTKVNMSEFVESLHLGGHGSHESAYSSYRIWLASLSAHCGWKIETESLRIPSTRNWALVGRTRLEDTVSARTHVHQILREVCDRGMFKTRKPEGKAGEH